MAKPPARERNGGSSFISLGGDVSFCVDGKDNLWIVDHTHDIHKPTEVYLGKATKKRIDDLQSYIGRMAIHAS